MKRFFVSSFIFIIFLISIKCTMIISGNTSETGNAALITGMIYEPGGMGPAVGVRVVIRSKDYFPKYESLGKRRIVDAFFECSTYTDSRGYYEFTTEDSIPEGLFIIEARDHKNDCVLIGNLKIDSFLYFSNSGENLNTSFVDTLKRPGAVKGSIQPFDTSTRALVGVVGLNVSTSVKSNGDFVLENLPEGTYRLLYIIKRNGIYTNDTAEVSVNSNNTTAVENNINKEVSRINPVIWSNDIATMNAEHFYAIINSDTLYPEFHLATELSYDTDINTFTIEIIFKADREIRIFFNYKRDSSAWWIERISAHYQIPNAYFLNPFDFPGPFCKTPNRKMYNGTLNIEGFSDSNATKIFFGNLSLGAFFNVNNVSWNSGQFSLKADNFYVLSDYDTLYPKMTDPKIGISIKDSLSYSAEIELEKNNSMKSQLSMSFKNDGIVWWVENVRAFDGATSQWINFEGPFFKTVLGSSFSGNEELKSTDNTLRKVHFSNMVMDGFSNINPISLKSNRISLQASNVFFIDGDDTNFVEVKSITENTNLDDSSKSSLQITFGNEAKSNIQLSFSTDDLQWWVDEISTDFKLSDGNCIIYEGEVLKRLIDTFYNGNYEVYCINNPDQRLCFKNLSLSVLSSNLADNKNPLRCETNRTLLYADNFLVISNDDTLYLIPQNYSIIYETDSTFSLEILFTNKLTTNEWRLISGFKHNLEEWWVDYIALYGSEKNQRFEGHFFNSPVNKTFNGNVIVENGNGTFDCRLIFQKLRLTAYFVL